MTRRCGSSVTWGRWGSWRGRYLRRGRARGPRAGRLNWGDEWCRIREGGGGLCQLQAGVCGAVVRAAARSWRGVGGATRAGCGGGGGVAGTGARRGGGGGGGGGFGFGGAGGGDGVAGTGARRGGREGGGVGFEFGVAAAGDGGGARRGGGGGVAVWGWRVRRGDGGAVVALV